MKTKPFLNRATLASLMFLFAACSGGEETNNGDGYGATETVSDDLVNPCLSSLKWLDKTPIPEPDYEHFPCGYAPNSNLSASNESFHEISWQYFLWLTEEVNVAGKEMLRFESMYNDASINIDGDTPEAREHILGGIQQAGSNSVLVDENGRAVYTSMMINDIYHDFVQKHDLNTVKGMEEVNPTLDFDNGSMSLKAAWKIIPKGQKAPEGAYTRTAKLYKVVEIDGVVTTSDKFVDPAKRETIEETVALVGLHIAVVVKDHPEFIWATFEHNSNAPSYFLKNQTTPTGVPTDQNYTFYKKNTPAENCNVANYRTIKVDPTTQVITGGFGEEATTHVYRRYQFGEGKPKNQDNIDNLNTMIHSKLPKGSMWKNYHEVGAIWFDIDNGHLEPEWSPTTDPKLMTGSLRLSSSVIETFTQDPNSQDNCFACHNTSRFTPMEGLSLAGKNVLTSHILLQNFIDKTTKGEVILETVDRD